MQSILEGVVLRKVAVQDRTAAASEQLAAAVEKEREQNQRLRNVDLESWYPALEPFTFKTVFVPISPDEARAIVDEYRVIKSNGNQMNSSSSSNDVLVSLRQKISTAMASLGSKSVFAKLSSRSPKDSRFCQDRAFNIVRAELLKHDRAQVDLHYILKTVMGASIQCLELFSAEEVISCFCTSDRVCDDDIPLALSFAHRSWTQHIILREWVPIPTQAEFRAFVLDGKLTGVSQYFTGAFFPSLVDHKERVLHMIQDLFGKIKGVIPVDPADYVLDLAIDVESNRSFVIELNPFGRPDGLGTGLCLFDRKNPEDLAVLFGDRSFEFRIETSVLPLNQAQILRDGQLKDFLIKEKFIT
jgi:hypothetical protein